MTPTRSILIAIVVLGAGASARAQSFSFGVKGGIALTDAIEGRHADFVGGSEETYSNSKDYLIGALAELRLPFGLGVEADALYRPYTLSIKTVKLATAISSTAIHGGEFPILVKYRFGTPIVKPYIDAGPSFRAFGSAGDGLSGRGFTLGGGVDVQALVLHVTPELRYTHWGQSQTINGATYPLNSSQSQLEFLVGITF